MTAGSANASLVISNRPTKNLSCSAGVCTATAKSAVMNANDLVTMLNASDVTLQTGSAAKDLDVKSAFSWASASRLTLDARRSIIFERSVTVAGAGALTLSTNDGGAGGALSFSENGRIRFWDLSGNLVIDGASYTLVGDIAALASDIAADPSGHYALAKNYDASVDGIYASSPIATTFSGQFEGLGNAISYLNIVDTTVGQNAGLFLEIDSRGSVRNPQLAGEHVQGANESMAGGVAGLNHGALIADIVDGSVSTGKGVIVHRVFYPAGAGALAAISDGIVEASSASAQIEGGNRSRIGGSIAWNKGAIRNSSASGAVQVIGTGVDYLTAGGLVGENDGKIVDAYATGAVFSTAGSIGGLVGENVGGSIARCRATGSVTDLKGGDAGGFAGGNYGTIDNSFATGNLTDHGNAEVAGFVGFDQGNYPITNSYSTGSVTAAPTSYVGGFAGVIDRATIESAYATGALSSGQFVGGFLAYDADTVHNFTDAYWDLDTTGVSDPSKGAGNIANDAGITGLTDAQLKSGLPAGFDPAIWAQDPAINGGLPYLIANPPR